MRHIHSLKLRNIIGKHRLACKPTFSFTYFSKKKKGYSNNLFIVIFIFSNNSIMTRYTKDAQGMYHIHGKKYEMLVGSRAQVVHGTAYKTTGGLKKDSLLQNKNGRIVSKSKHNSAKKEKRLVKAGYVTKKGKFGFIKVGSKSRRSRSNKRGGSSASSPFVSQPAPVGDSLMLAGGRRTRRRRGSRRR